MSAAKHAALVDTYQARNLGAVGDAFLSVAECADNALRLVNEIQSDDHGHLLAGVAALLRQIGATADTAALHCGAPHSALGGGLLDGAMHWAVSPDLCTQVVAHAQVQASAPANSEGVKLWASLPPDVFRMVRPEIEALASVAGGTDQGAAS